MADRITLKSFHVASGTSHVPTATVELEIDGHTITQTGTGDGPVDAVYRTIAAITETKSTLLMYVVKAITGGTDAQGEVSVRVQEEGRTVSGHGADTDIITASARAYLNALNKLSYLAGKQAQGEHNVRLI
jgi:2-isopropylmalate synthase